MNYDNLEDQKRKQSDNSKNICNTFKTKGSCPNKNNCPFKHVKSYCKDFEKGFCMKGDECLDFHEIKELCKNYMYGFCPQGPNCTKGHPKMLLDLDVILLKNLDNDTRIAVCNNCKKLGHKSNNCIKEKFFN